MSSAVVGCDDLGMVAGRSSRTRSNQNIGLTVRSNPNEKDILKLDVRRVMTHLGLTEVLLRIGLAPWGLDSGEVIVDLDTTGTSNFGSLIRPRGQSLVQCLVEPADGFRASAGLAAQHPRPRRRPLPHPRRHRMTIDEPVRVRREVDGQLPVPRSSLPDRGLLRSLIDHPRPGGGRTDAADDVRFHRVRGDHAGRSAQSTSGMTVEGDPRRRRPDPRRRRVITHVGEDVVLIRVGFWAGFVPPQRVRSGSTPTARRRIDFVLRSAACEVSTLRGQPQLRGPGPQWSSQAGRAVPRSDEVAAHERGGALRREEHDGRPGARTSGLLGF